MAPHIAVVEDEVAIRTAAAVALRDGGYRVTPLADGTRLSQLAADDPIDLAVLDLTLPAGPDGLELARWLHEHHDTPVIVVSARDTWVDKDRAYAAGVDQYLTKPFPLPELLLRVNALLRRTGALEAPTLHADALAIDTAAHRVTVDGDPVDLTLTEFRLLSVLVARPGHALTKQQLLREVWQSEYHDPNRVEAHMSSLRRKLQAAGGPPITTVRGVGYRLEPVS